jgi:2,6-dihydroxypseudooxynicotine hydrolase
VSRELVESALHVHGGRFAGDGVHAVDLETIVAKIRTWENWYPAWAAVGDRYERLARTALEARSRTTAGELFWQASISYHYAQFLFFHNRPLREEGQRKKQDVYNLAAPLLVPAAQRLDLPIDGAKIPGFLRLPAGPGPFPVVVLLGGLESTKEESYHFENMLLKRGVATCAFDGPGQGEMFFQLTLQPDFEKYTSAVIDWIHTRREIDPDGIGILGRSLGGYYAIRSAVFDHRIKACVAWGPLYDMSAWDQMAGLTRLGFQYVSGQQSEAAAKAYLHDAINLRGVAGRLRCALYVLHGAKDDLIPASQIDRLDRDVQGASEKVITVEPEGNHCCHNLYPVVRPRMADWLAQKLTRPAT